MCLYATWMVCYQRSCGARWMQTPSYVLRCLTAMWYNKPVAVHENVRLLSTGGILCTSDTGQEYVCISLRSFLCCFVSFFIFFFTTLVRAFDEKGKARLKQAGSAFGNFSLHRPLYPRQNKQTFKMAYRDTRTHKKDVIVTVLWLRL